MEHINHMFHIILFIKYACIEPGKQYTKTTFGHRFHCLVDKDCYLQRIEFGLPNQFNKVACHFTANGFFGKVSQQTGKVSQQIGKVSQQTGKVSQQTGKVSQQTGKISQQTGKISQQTGKVSQQTEKMSLDRCCGLKF